MIANCLPSCCKFGREPTVRGRFIFSVPDPTVRRQFEASAPPEQSRGRISRAILDDREFMQQLFPDK